MSRDALQLSRRQRRRLAGHYPFWKRKYASGKLRTDPLYAAVACHLLAHDDGHTPLLDLGCGMGLFAFYLREAGFRAPITGIDYDVEKVDLANEIAARHYTGLTFQAGDARENLPSFRGHLSILDVLQYLTLAQQAELLAAAAASVPAKGLLVIRSGLRDLSWRYRVTRWADRAARAILWMKAMPADYPTKESILDGVAAAGLRGEFTPLWGRTPFNNYLGVLRRPQGLGQQDCGKILEGHRPCPAADGLVADRGELR